MRFIGIFLIFVVINLINPVRPQYIDENYIRDFDNHHGIFPKETGLYSTCCPSNPYDDTHSYPKECDFFPVDSRYIPESCHYYESITGISCETREYFMEMALNFTFEASGSKCPLYPFGAIIVNHTKGPNIEDADIISMGMNKVYEKGSHLWHGEMSALHGAGKVLLEKFGTNVVNKPEIWQQLSLYTTGEPCPLCASALRWSKIGEIIYSTSIPDLNKANYFQPNIRIKDVQQRTNWCNFAGLNSTTSYQTRIIIDVLSNKTLPYFLAFNPSFPCPEGCERPSPSEKCKDKEKN